MQRAFLARPQRDEKPAEITFGAMKSGLMATIRVLGSLLPLAGRAIAYDADASAR